MKCNESSLCRTTPTTNKTIASISMALWWTTPWDVSGIWCQEMEIFPFLSTHMLVCLMCFTFGFNYSLSSNSFSVTLTDKRHSWMNDTGSTFGHRRRWLQLPVSQDGDGGKPTERIVISGRSNIWHTSNMSLGCAGPNVVWGVTTLSDPFLSI